jgi:hypothetical protein
MSFLSWQVKLTHLNVSICVVLICKHTHTFNGEVPDYGVAGGDVNNWDQLGDTTCTIGILMPTRTPGNIIQNSNILQTVNLLLRCYIAVAKKIVQYLDVHSVSRSVSHAWRHLCINERITTAYCRFSE